MEFTAMELLRLKAIINDVILSDKKYVEVYGEDWGSELKLDRNILEKVEKGLKVS